jgi:outer membrane lipoprotein SlyB
VISETTDEIVASPATAAQGTVAVLRETEIGENLDTIPAVAHLTLEKKERRIKIGRVHAPVAAIALARPRAVAKAAPEARTISTVMCPVPVLLPEMIGEMYQETVTGTVIGTVTGTVIGIVIGIGTGTTIGTATEIGIGIGVESAIIGTRQMNEASGIRTLRIDIFQDGGMMMRRTEPQTGTGTEIGQGTEIETGTGTDGEGIGVGLPARGVVLDAEHWCAFGTKVSQTRKFALVGTSFLRAC